MLWQDDMIILPKHCISALSSVRSKSVATLQNENISFGLIENSGPTSATNNLVSVKQLF
jgi:hypothetical protein